MSDPDTTTGMTPDLIARLSEPLTVHLSVTGMELGTAKAVRRMMVERAEAASALQEKDKEIAELERRRDENMRTAIRYDSLWKRATADLAAARAQIETMREALERAVETIRNWNGMGIPRSQEPAVWKAYQASPEMKQINAALTANSKTPRPEKTP